MYTRKIAYLLMLLSSLTFVGCGGGSSQIDTNTPPVANAGEDQNVITTSTVTLDGSASSDANSDTLTYSWSMTSSPDGSTAVLSDTTIVNPTFVADLNGSYVIQLIVNDGSVDSMIDAVTVTSAANTAPIADAGIDKYVFTSSTVTLDGSASSDANSDTLTYSWSMTSSPDGSTAVLSDITIVNPTFVADLNGSYVIQLIVNDGTADSIADTVTITAATFSDVQAHDPSFESTHFSGSQNCAQCHDGITDTSNGEDVSIVQAWKGTMMDHAAIDPLYLAKVASEVQRNPNFKEFIEDKCSRCHMPMANVEAGFAGDPIAMFGDGFTNPNNPHYDAAKEGVSCTLCHQIEDTPELGTSEGSSGGFVIAENLGADRVTYGPYTNPKTGPMVNNVQFTPKYSAHMNDSKLCSACHNLDTPVIDVTTNTLNGSTFPEQAPYTEWEYSDFNGTTSCQECHMPQSEGSVIISTAGNVGERTPFYQHKFLGVNTYMLDILKNNLTKLGSAADTATFEESISNTKEFLKASADVNITSTNFDNGALEFSVKVTNHSGHKFPTSIPIRRAWLHVTVTNTADQSIVFESGAMNDNYQIIGVDDSTTSVYQEHHEEIDDDSEVQVYEAIMIDTAGNQTYTLLNASSYVKDNRLLPKGYKSTTPANAQPYGEAIDDDDFVGGSDSVDYEVSDLPVSTYEVTVTLKYQTVSYGFMQDLYKDANLTEVALMKVLDDNAKIRFEDISTDTATYTP